MAHEALLLTALLQREKFFFFLLPFAGFFFSLTIPSV